MSSSGSPTDRLGDALKVVVVIGHPRASSLCHSLAAAYVEGARSVGVDVNTIDLAELFFEGSSWHIKRPYSITSSPLRQ